MKISDYLKELSNGFKDREFARVLNVNETEYHKLINGKKDTYKSITITVNLCKIFGINPKDLNKFDYYVPDSDLIEIINRLDYFDFDERKKTINNKKILFKEMIDKSPLFHNRKNGPEVISKPKKESPRAKQKRLKKQRVDEMKKMYNDNYTFEEIAEHYGISRQRVQQLISGKRYKTKNPVPRQKFEYKGNEYPSRRSLLKLLFPNDNATTLETYINGIKKRNGITDTEAIDYCLNHSIKHHKKPKKEIYFRDKKYKTYKQLFNEYLPEENCQSLLWKTKEIQKDFDVNFDEAFEFLLFNIDDYREYKNVSLFGKEYRTKTDAYRDIFPTFEIEKVRSTVNQRMRFHECSWQEAVEMTVKKPPEERLGVTFNGVHYNSYRELYRKLFKGRKAENVMCCVHGYRKSHGNCSWEDAVNALIEYGHKNKRIEIIYDGKEYASLREFCKDYNISPQSVAHYRKRKGLYMYQALDHFVKNKNGN